MHKFIPVSEPSITQKEIDYVTDAVKSGWVSSIGKYVELFESDFAKFCNVKYAIAISNGTTALHLALVSLGIKKGDEVIVPDFTFIATANAVTYTGATPVFADIDAKTLCISPDSIRKKITDKTKAIIPVHIYGHPANMPEICEIANQHNLFIIEDAAESHGACINQRKTGSFGHCAIFSFYGNKIITTGEGGIITTNDENLFNKACHLRDHAMSKYRRYWHDEIGYNYRMTNLQAALGVAQLERINELIEKRQQIFKLYQNYLSDINGIRLNYTEPWATNIYWVIYLEIEKFTLKERDEFMIALKNKGIDTRPYFFPNSDMPMYTKTDTPVTHKVYQKGILLPCYFNLTDQDIVYTCNIVKSILNKDI